ncbi:hypothetical protein IV70_GL001821 [Carnobacterium maltaromaticum DSM 20342]|nr:hypothetical protein IV70_GL001821 [Carnobacterium maltaromaticum DSM 20342]
MHYGMLQIKVIQSKDPLLKLGTLFLDGLPGTGKTYFINYLKEITGEKMIVLDFLSPTAEIIASLNKINTDTKVIAIDHLNLEKASPSKKELAETFFDIMNSYLETAASSWNVKIIVTSPNAHHLSYLMNTKKRMKDQMEWEESEKEHAENHSKIINQRSEE